MCAYLLYNRITTDCIVNIIKRVYRFYVFKLPVGILPCHNHILDRCGTCPSLRTRRPRLRHEYDHTLRTCIVAWRSPYCAALWASRALVKRLACERSALAKVSNQSATSSKPSSRAVLAMPGYMSVYSCVSPWIALSNA